MTENAEISRSAVARLLGSTILSQAFLSGANFLVSFMLIRRLGDDQYGYYVLATVTLLLLASLQGSFFQPPIVVALSRLDLPARQALVGGLSRARKWIALLIFAFVVVADGVAWVTGLFDFHEVCLVAVGSLAALAVLHREFYRGVLLAYHQANSVLRNDLVYVTLLIAGAFTATYMPMATVMAVASIGIAAFCGGRLMSRSVWRFEPWDPQGGPGVLRDISKQGAWSVFGAATHWSFSQGYTYIVAATLDLRAVAAIAATRLLLMPINMLSSGVNQSVFPLVSRWHEQIGAKGVFRRIITICALLVAVIAVYALVVWLMRGWFFDVFLKKSFENRDQLILLWIAVFLVMTVRDQLGILLTVRSRLKELSQFTFFSAVLALIVIRYAITDFGPAGALIGILVGELVNIAGILILSIIEIRRETNDSAMT
jgi:O-antigen/teichoic acid export membrane protein